jgi:hypothetical protein
MEPMMEHLHDFSYDPQHLKLASDRMKTRYKRLVNCTGYLEGDKLWLYHPTYMKEKSPKLQSSWEGPYKIVTRINYILSFIFLSNTTIYKLTRISLHN